MIDRLASFAFRLFMDRHVDAQMPAEGPAVRPSSFRGTPRTRLADAEAGQLVKLVGTSRPTGELLAAPDGGNPCLARAVLAQNRQSTWWSLAPWRRVESAMCAFELVDGDAVVAVIASGVEVLGAQTRSRPTRFGAPVQRDVWLLPGKRIAVLGRVTDAPPAAEGYRDEAARTRRVEAVALTDDETCFH